VTVLELVRIPAIDYGELLNQVLEAALQEVDQRLRADGLEVLVFSARQRKNERQREVADEILLFAGCE